ncbi:MAG: hypothetical protein PHE49_04680 [bacterium]|nr:hypothetical protein [bacterium]
MMKKFLFGGMLLVPFCLFAAGGNAPQVFSTIKLLGIATYLLIGLVAFSGIRGWEIKKHKLIAIIAISFATIHAIIVLLLKFIIKR